MQHNGIFHGNDGHAIANGTRTARYKTSEHDNSGRISDLADNCSSVVIQMQKPFRKDDVLVKDEKVRVQFVGISSRSLCNKPGLIWPKKSTKYLVFCLQARSSAYFDLWCGGGPALYDGRWSSLEVLSRWALSTRVTRANFARLKVSKFVLNTSRGRYSKSCEQ